MLSITVSFTETKWFLKKWPWTLNDLCFAKIKVALPLQGIFGETQGVHAKTLKTFPKSVTLALNLFWLWNGNSVGMMWVTGNYGSKQVNTRKIEKKSRFNGTAQWTFMLQTITITNGYRIWWGGGLKFYRKFCQSSEVSKVSSCRLWSISTSPLWKVSFLNYKYAFSYLSVHLCWNFKACFMLKCFITS